MNKPNRNNTQSSLSNAKQVPRAEKSAVNIGNSMSSAEDNAASRGHASLKTRLGLSAGYDASDGDEPPSADEDPDIKASSYSADMEGSPDDAQFYDDDEYAGHYPEVGDAGQDDPAPCNEVTSTPAEFLCEATSAISHLPAPNAGDAVADLGQPLATSVDIGPDPLYVIGARLGQPTGDDLSTLHSRRRKLLEVAEAAGCKHVVELLRNGHTSLSVAAIRDNFALKGANFAYENGFLYRYNDEYGRYEIANAPFERELLELSVGLTEEARRMRLVASVWENKPAAAVLAAMPKFRSGQAFMQDCRAALYPLWQSPHRMNGDQWTLNVCNGLLDLTCQTLRPHTPTHMSSLQLPFAFDPDAGHPHWDAYLEAAIPDSSVRGVLQEWTGYCLIPTTKFEMALFLIGPGGTGKSTFIKSLRKLVGEGNCTAVGLEDLGDKFRVGGLRDKLLNVVTEINPNKALNDARFKAFVSGDPVTGEQKFKDPGVFQPYARFVVAANTLPQVRDQTDAFYRRVIMIRFDQKFAANPNPMADPPEKPMDPDLGAKLDAELSGILNWALAGLARLSARGRFEIPATLLANVEAFREDQDNALRLLHDACMFGPEFEVSTSDAFRLYVAWCKANGEKPHANNVFGRIVSNHKGIQAKKSGTKGRFYKGLRPADGAVAAGAGTGTARGEAAPLPNPAQGDSPA